MRTTDKDEDHWPRLEPRPRKRMEHRFNKSMFSSLFWANNLINVFAIFASEDGKQLLSHLYVEIL